MATHQFQSYADISTKENDITMITVYAGGNTALMRSLPQFSAFKYYKLGPVNIKLIPASTLPVDPTGLSYEAGENLTDPRDLLTPGLVRITNGEDFFTDIHNSSYTTPYRRAVYDAMMLDDRWFKWSLQKGISKTAQPRYWMVGQIRQDYYPGSVANAPQLEQRSDLNTFKSTAAYQEVVQKYESSGEERISRQSYTVGDHSSGRGLFQTGDHGVLGWLPTDALIHLSLPGANPNSRVAPAINNIPQVELFRILMPPAFKTRFYYRMFVTETIYFKDPVIQTPEYFYMEDGQEKSLYAAPLDRFIRQQGLWALGPFSNHKPGLPQVPEVPNDATNNKRNITGGDVKSQ